MTEFVPASRSKVKLSFEDRLYIIQTVNALPPTQFDELVFALDPPKGIVPHETAAQGSRSKALLDWIESPTGPGLFIVDEYLQRIIPRATKTADRLTAFAISGRLGDLPTTELEAIVQLLRQKTGDDSIDIAFFSAGSIKLILTGSSAGLEKLQELFESGELANFSEKSPVEYVQSINTDTTTAKKARLIQTLRLHVRTRASILARDIEAIDILDSGNIMSAIRHSQDAARELANEVERNANYDGHLQEITRTLVSELFVAGEIARDLDRSNGIRELARILTRASYRAVSLATRISESGIDLSGLDLSGANLRDIYLKDIPLVEADLSYAIVEGAIFGDNPGLSTTAKDELRERGAIIQDAPGSNTLSLLSR